MMRSPLPGMFTPPIAGLAYLPLAIAACTAAPHLVPPPTSPIAAAPSPILEYMPPSWIPLTTTEGRDLLKHAHYSRFIEIATFYETQRTLTTCGLASAAITLNALSVPAPLSRLYPTYRYYTQDELLTPCTESIKPSQAITDSGLTLNQLKALLECYPVNVDLVSGETLTEDSLRNLLKLHLTATKTVILANYSRLELGQGPGGHISPLVAYTSSKDSALILDVARYRYPPAWVPIHQLCSALASVDSDSKSPRGLLIVTPQ